MCTENDDDGDNNYIQSPSPQSNCKWSNIELTYRLVFVERFAWKSPNSRYTLGFRNACPNSCRRTPRISSPNAEFFDCRWSSRVLYFHCSQRRCCFRCWINSVPTVATVIVGSMVASNIQLAANLDDLKCAKERKYKYFTLFTVWNAKMKLNQLIDIRARWTSYVLLVKVKEPLQCTHWMNNHEFPFPTVDGSSVKIFSMRVNLRCFWMRWATSWVYLSSAFHSIVSWRHTSKCCIKWNSCINNSMIMLIDWRDAECRWNLSNFCQKQVVGSGGNRMIMNVSKWSANSVDLN